MGDRSDARGPRDRRRPGRPPRGPAGLPTAARSRAGDRSLRQPLRPRPSVRFRDRPAAPGA